MSEIIQYIKYFFPAVLLFINTYCLNPQISNPPSSSDWRNHPEIKDIHKISNEINSKIGSFNMYIPECNDNTYIEIYKDKKTRLFKMDQRGEDFGYVLKLFYDSKNRLRYVSMLNSGYLLIPHSNRWLQMETDIFYNKNGKLIWQYQKEKEKPETENFNQSSDYKNTSFFSINKMMNNYGCED